MSSFDLLFSEKTILRSHTDSDGLHPLSQWAQSSTKGWFDVVCILCAVPIWLPVLLFTAVAVRLTSRGPILFRQERVGRYGSSFTIFKFRTMPVADQNTDRPRVTTSVNQRFTAVGQFLRRSKLDELPQLLNVLRGEMSLVGPRPKLACHQVARLACRPGITGQATLVFAREESALAGIPSAHLESFYEDVILPLKQVLDDEYMAAATLRTDLFLLFNSVFRKGRKSDVSNLLDSLSARFANQSDSPLQVLEQTSVSN
jgi:lipopolysaccharide/colanic/teichoic acid biosynthesis glycosyltransferase